MHVAASSPKQSQSIQNNYSCQQILSLSQCQQPKIYIGIVTVLIVEFLDLWMFGFLGSAERIDNFYELLFVLWRQFVGVGIAGEEI